MNSPQTHSGINSSWLLPLRLITFTVICGVIMGWMNYPAYMKAPFLSYCFITLASFVTLLFLKRVNILFLFRFLIAIHFISEIVCEASIIYTTGNLNSQFSVLFLLTIVSAALAYRLAGTLLVASFVSLAFSAVIWIDIPLANTGGQILFIPLENSISGDELIFYSAFLHILIFYLVAFIAGFLAGKLRSKDIELHSASAELKQARLETGDILRHLNSGLMTVDQNGHVAYFNHAAEIILGLEAGDVSGRDFRDVFAGRLAILAENLLGVFKSREGLSRSEFEILDNSGAKIPIGISTSTLFDENFDVRGVIAIFQDITEAKKLEERVRRADRMAAIGELSASIAHEIRNPLASISGSVEVLKNDLALDGDDEKLMNLIVKESSRLNKILSDFLNYARVGRPQLRKVELNRIILDTIEIVRRHPSFKSGVKIKLISDSHITYVSADEDQLRQVILNLTINACEALTDKGGNIQFEVRVGDNEGEGEVCLVIRDDGSGIPKEKQDEIFLPFYSTKKTGTGLGLAIVARLIEAHHGKIELYSDEGKGTEFHLYFRRIIEETNNPRSKEAQSILI